MPLSEYELQRQRTIEENQKKLDELGLGKAAADMRTMLAKPKSDKGQAVKRCAPGDVLPTVATRHSGRIAKNPVEYTFDDLQDFDDDEDIPKKKTKHNQRAAPTSSARPQRISKAPVSYETLQHDAEHRRKQQSRTSKSRPGHASLVTTTQPPAIPPPMMPPTTMQPQTVRIPTINPFHAIDRAPAPVIHPVYQYPVRPGAKIAACPLCSARFVLRQDGQIRKHSCTGAPPSTTISLSVTEDGEPAIATSDGYVVPTELFM